MQICFGGRLCFLCGRIILKGALVLVFEGVVCPRPVKGSPERIGRHGGLMAVLFIYFL